MARSFAAYFTLKGAWRSSDIKELGVFNSEQAAMRAGQRHASQHGDRDPLEPRNLVWKRVPMGVAAPTSFGRYDVREATAG